jgi:hypothetical protein
VVSVTDPYGRIIEFLSVIEQLYRPSDQRLLAKLVTTFEDRECHVVIVTDPYGRILGFLDRTDKPMRTLNLIVKIMSVLQFPVYYK